MTADGADDLNRQGAMSLRARLVSLQRRLDNETAAREKAESDAAKLAQFIADRGVTAAWAHADVVALVESLHITMVARLREVAGRMAASGSVASHVIYAREIERVRRTAAKEAAALLANGLTRPDMVTGPMRDDMGNLVDPQDRTV